MDGLRCHDAWQNNPAQVFLLFYLLVLLLYAACGWLALWLLSMLVNLKRQPGQRIQIPGGRILGTSIFLLSIYFTVAAISRPPEWRSILYEEMFDACRDGSLVRARLWLLLGASPDGASDYAAGPHGAEFGSHVEVAVMNRNDRLLRLLLEKGASPDLVSGEGGTALSSAIHDHNTEAVKLLLAAGANPWCYNQGTAIDHAKRLKFDDLIPIIRPYLGDE